MAYIRRAKYKSKINFLVQVRRQEFKTIVKSFDIDSYLILKYSSLSSLQASLSIPIYLIFFLEGQNIFFFLIMLVLIFFTHRENVKRLINKEESKTKIY